MKTKILVFGKNQQDSNVKDIYFNGRVIHRSQKYKYLGNLLSETQTNRGDVFKYIYVTKLEMLSSPLKRNWTILVSYHQK